MLSAVIVVNSGSVVEGFGGIQNLRGDREQSKGK